MMLSRLGSTASNLCKINRTTALLASRSMRKKISEDDEDDKPIPFSSSPAAQWKAAHSRVPPNHRVWYTGHVVSLSTAIFLIYFCILREENDIDEMIYRPLPETLKGIEKRHPEFDFYTKPDYVRYHEDRKQAKELAR